MQPACSRNTCFPVTIIGGERNGIYWINKFSPKTSIPLSKGDHVWIRGELRGKVKKEEPTDGNKYYGYKLVAKKIIKEPVASDPTGVEV